MERLRNCGGSLTIPCQGSLIVPSGNIDTFPLINEFNLDPRRLTTAQSPLGGVNGLVDYAPGSVHVTEGDGIYLTDVAGNNTSKDLPAGLLSRLGYLTVDTVAHSITEEFIVSNTATSNNPTVINDGTVTTNWSMLFGTGTISVESGRLKIEGTTDSTGRFTIKNNTNIYDLSTFHFLSFSIESTISGNQYFKIVGGGASEKLWAAGSISANTNSVLIHALKSPVGTTPCTPGFVSGTFNYAASTFYAVGLVTASPSSAITMYIDNITVDVAKPAYIETAVPDNITSVVYQKWTGSTYETNCIANMDSVYSTTFLDSAKMVLNDGTKFDDVYGSGNGRSRFVKGASGQTVNGSLAGTTMTYRAVKGTSKRIGVRVDLPPSDGGRTAFNQCRIKKIIFYTDVNRASVTLPDISGNGNNGTMSMVGLTADNLGNPYGAMSFDGVRSYVNCGSPLLYNVSSITIAFSFMILGANPWGLLISKGAWSDGNPFIVGFGATNNLYTSVKTENGKSSGYWGFVPTVGAWYRAVITYDSVTGLHNYINNVEYTGASANGVMAISNLPLLLGGHGPIDLFIYGKMKNVCLYDRVLTAAERASDTLGDIATSGLVGRWQPSTVSHMGQSTYDLSNDSNTSTGLLNISNPWLAIIDPTTKNIDYYIFTERPTSLSYKRDESGNVYEVVVNPGNGLVYNGSTVWANDTLDTNSDSEPDMLDATIQNSIAQMLSLYGFNR